MILLQCNLLMFLVLSIWDNNFIFFILGWIGKVTKLNAFWWVTAFLVFGYFYSYICRYDCHCCWWYCVGNQAMITKCWCVTPVIKDIILSALSQWWRQYQRMAGSARFATAHLFAFLIMISWPASWWDWSKQCLSTDLSAAVIGLISKLEMWLLVYL